jgi:hypothetical protein
VRTSTDRMAELLDRFQKRHWAGIRDLLTNEVREAHNHNPLGPHDDQTSRVLRAMRSASVTGKHVVVSLGSDGPWGIGVVSPGLLGSITLGDVRFQGVEDAMREVFSLRYDHLRQR